MNVNQLDSEEITVMRIYTKVIRKDMETMRTEWLV